MAKLAQPFRVGVDVMREGISDFIFEPSHDLHRRTLHRRRDHGEQHRHFLGLGDFIFIQCTSLELRKRW